MAEVSSYKKHAFAAMKDGERNPVPFLVTLKSLTNY